MNRKKNCLDCLHVDPNGNECFCAEGCIDHNQYILDEDIIEHEWEEAMKIVREIYKEAGGPWGDPVISEELYDRMKSLIEKNE